ncbi:unnamed protein product, partial [Polarella glacialis]
PLATTMSFGCLPRRATWAVQVSGLLAWRQQASRQRSAVTTPSSTPAPSRITPRPAKLGSTRCWRRDCRPTSLAMPQSSTPLPGKEMRPRQGSGSGESAGIEPDAVSYKSLIHACGVGGHAEAAERWLEAAASLSLRPLMLVRGTAVPVVFGAGFAAAAAWQLQVPDTSQVEDEAMFAPQPLVVEALDPMPVAVPVAGGSSSSTAANSANPPPPAAVRATASDGASASPPPEGRPARKKEEGGLFARGFLNKPPKKRPAAKAEAASSRQRSRSPGRGASTDASSSQQLGSRKDGDAGDVGATALRAAHETIAKEQARDAFARMRDAARGAGLAREEGQAYRLYGNSLDKLDAPGEIPLPSWVAARADDEIEEAYKKALTFAHNEDARRHS